MMDLTLDELIEGQSTPAGRPPSWESPYLSVAHDVARGMAYLHQHNIIHRDLKPGSLALARPAPCPDMPATRPRHVPCRQRAAQAANDDCQGEI